MKPRETYISRGIFMLFIECVLYDHLKVELALFGEILAIFLSHSPCLFQTI